MELIKKLFSQENRCYEYEPPSDYYLDGYNTFKRIKEDFEDYVLFLRDITVPPTNNIAERMGRKFKRKAHQVMSFRSMSGLEYFCDGLSIMEIPALKVGIF